MAVPYSFAFFFFNDTATTEIYTLSLHDALPISGEQQRPDQPPKPTHQPRPGRNDLQPQTALHERVRSEEHTSELQSHLNLVCRLLLEKKKSGEFKNWTGLLGMYAFSLSLLRTVL